VRFGLQTDQEMMYGFFFHTVIARKEPPSERKREHTDQLDAGMIVEIGPHGGRQHGGSRRAFPNPALINAVIHRSRCDAR